MPPSPTGPPWLAAAAAAIDAANAEDPNVLVADDSPHPKAQIEGRLVAVWVARLAPDASPALQLAARAHHLRRWTSPRSAYPAGRSGYLRWRRDLYGTQAREAAAVLAAAGVDPDVIARVEALVRKENLARDPEVQTLEDAICLVFLETQLPAFIEPHDDDRVVQILAKTLDKMSDAGRTAAAQVSLTGRAAALAQRAMSAR